VVNESLESRLAEAIGDHNAGVAGNKAAVQRAQAQFQSLREQYPDNATVLAYSGSTLALMARDALKPVERLDLAKQGLALLDQAVAAAPGEPSFRMLRGKIAFRLPEAIFHRTETAIEDYVVLINMELLNPGSIEEKTYATLVYELGVAYYRMKRMKEARLCWSMLPKLTEDAELLALARTKNTSLGRRTDASKSEPFAMRNLAGALIGLAGASLLSFAKRR